MSESSLSFGWLARMARSRLVNSIAGYPQRHRCRFCAKKGKWGWTSKTTMLVPVTEAMPDPDKRLVRVIILRQCNRHSEHVWFDTTPKRMSHECYGRKPKHEKRPDSQKFQELCRIAKVPDWMLSPNQRCYSV